MVKLFLRYISFRENYVFAAIIYFGLGLMLYAIIPDPIVSFSFAQNGCGGEEDCPDGQQCINGECTDTPCENDGECGSDEACCNGKCFKTATQKCCGAKYVCGKNEDCCEKGCKKSGQECCGNGEPGNCCDCSTPSKPKKCPEVQK